MLTVSTELQPILNGIVQFISYMVLAVFAENVILARALGVTRLMKLVPTTARRSGISACRCCWSSRCPHLRLGRTRPVFPVAA